ncbi:hypothetical protein HK102_010179, partial [Quaeritorhiza haematococci]
IISKHCFGVYDLTFDLDRNVCPICKTFVDPKECGFYCCEYRFAGLKFDAATGKYTEFCSEWRVCTEEDAYQLFEQDRNGSRTGVG